MNSVNEMLEHMTRHTATRDELDVLWTEIEKLPMAAKLAAAKQAVDKALHTGRIAGRVLAAIHPEVAKLDVLVERRREQSVGDLRRLLSRPMGMVIAELSEDKHKLARMLHDVARVVGVEPKTRPDGAGT